MRTTSFNLALQVYDADISGVGTPAPLSDKSSGTPLFVPEIYGSSISPAFFACLRARLNTLASFVTWATSRVMPSRPG